MLLPKKDYGNYFYILFFYAIIIPIIIPANPYLKAPQPMSAHELEQIILDRKTVDFTWLQSGVVFNCFYKEGQAGFAFTALVVPDNCKNLFQLVDQDGVAFYACTRGVKKEKLRVPELHSKPTADYLVAQPRIFKDLPEPLSITAEQLTDYINNHTVIFYTGAGLSIASGLPSMAQLENALYIKRNSNGELNMQNIISHSGEILESMKMFCEKAVEAQPTAAHNAIAALSRSKKCAVFTENVDVLHHKSGIAPLMASADLNKDSAYFKDINAIVCIGLSHDDRGLLAFFKECNPAGVIIAIDLKQPDYLGSEDMLVLGDLQQIIPSYMLETTGSK